jgi:hypothetical protein
VKNLKIKLGSIDEARESLEQTPEFDKGILDYPTLRIVTAYNGKGFISHLPSQQALVLESVGVNPEATELEKAQAIRYALNGQMLVASSFNLKEIYFIGTDEHVISLAESHGFERLPWPVLRLKL